MHEQSNILISVRSRFVDSMLKGTKRVELRRRTPRINADTRVWIYNKAPVAAVTAMAILGAIETLNPDELWRRYHSVLDLSLNDFEAYVSGRDKVAALCLLSVHPLRPVSLARMRQVAPTFHPPQFYLHLGKSAPLLNALEESVLVS